MTFKASTTSGSKGLVRKPIAPAARARWRTSGLSSPVMTRMGRYSSAEKMDDSEASSWNPSTSGM
jgi:hypothetical protein